MCNKIVSEVGRLQEGQLHLVTGGSICWKTRPRGRYNDFILKKEKAKIKR